MSEQAARPISLAALTVLEVSPVEAVRIARACGYSHIGLRPVAATPDEPHVPILDHAANRAELRRVLAGEGIEVLDCEIVRLTDKVDWDQMVRMVAFTAEFDAARLLVADNDPDPARSADSLARLADLGRAHGVIPCLEFMPWTCAPDLSAARARISGIEGVALLIDAFHLARSGGTPDDLCREDRVSYLQLCDIAGPIPPMEAILHEARAERLFPGEGEIPLAALLHRLPGLPLSLEVPANRLRDAGVSAEDRARRAIAATRRLLSSEPADADM